MFIECANSEELIMLSVISISDRRYNDTCTVHGYRSSDFLNISCRATICLRICQIFHTRAEFENIRIQVLKCSQTQETQEDTLIICAAPRT